MYVSYVFVALGDSGKLHKHGTPVGMRCSFWGQTEEVMDVKERKSTTAATLQTHSCDIVCEDFFYSGVRASKCCHVKTECRVIPTKVDT